MNTKTEKKIPSLLPSIKDVISESSENRRKIKEAREKEISNNIKEYNNKMLLEMDKSISVGFDECSLYIGDLDIGNALVSQYKKEKYEAFYNSVSGTLRLSWTK